jgi:acetyl-CoA C-acetyltransferase
MAARTRCGSGLQAVLYAAGQVATGAASVAVAGGAESMSNVEHYAVACEPACAKGPLRCTTGWTRARETAGGTNYPARGGMIETAENHRDRLGVGARRCSLQRRSLLVVALHHAPK